MAKQGTTSESKYDVFLSFAGKDTRQGFTGSLYNALCTKGIHTFIDDEKLRFGETLRPTLVEAIRGSRISIVVLSENYAASSWCLDELLAILECKTEKNQQVWPIFYKVDPSDVRNQRNSYGKALTELENNYSIEKVNKWKLALAEVANISGEHLKESQGYEYKLLRKIVRKALDELSLEDTDIEEHVFGLESRVEEVKSLLDESNNSTLMLGIHGSGGIGKTTLAHVLYNTMRNQFESACILNVREKSNEYSAEGRKHLQQTLLSEILEEEIKLTSDNQGTNMIRARLRRKNVLLVLDDVDDKKQLEALAGGHDWFGSGSRIIITARDKHLLDAHEVDQTYEMQLLNDHDSRTLFCWHAFKEEHPPTNLEALSNRAIRYAQGLPLALRVIGSLMWKQDLSYCNGVMNQCEKHPDQGIQNILKISYDHLKDDEEKDIFLDIACFFKGKSLEYVKEIWEACGFNPVVGIKNLVDKSLITVEYGLLRMHDLIQDMGKEIVRGEAPEEAGERSRLWYHEDVNEVLTQNTGSGKIKGIMLNPPRRQEIVCADIAFEKMKKLRILIIRNTSFSSGPIYLPNNLKALDWKEYPSQSLPPGFNPDKIVALNLRGSPLLVLEKLFEGCKHLTRMNFSDCHSITQIPDVSAAKNLREFRLDRCEKLIRVDKSVGFLPNLVHFSASECTRLRSFVPRIHLPSLQYLSFNFCRSLQQFPVIVKKMDKRLKIYLINTAIRTLPDSIGNLTGLDYLEMTGCMGLQNLPADRLFKLENFGTLKIGGCSKLRDSFRRFEGSHPPPNLKALHFRNANLSDEDLHVVIHIFPKLEELDVSWNQFASLPARITESIHLTSLDVSYCGELREIPELPLSVRKVDARHCHSLTSDASTILWSQVRKGEEILQVLMPETEIPEWFDHREKGGVPVFKIRGKFPVVALALVFGDVNDKGPLPIHWRPVGLHLFIDDKHVHRRHHHNFTLAEHHVLLCDLRVLFSDEEWKELDARTVGDEWKTLRVECETDLILNYWGVYVKQKETNGKGIQFGDYFTTSGNNTGDVQRSKEEKVRNKIDSLDLPRIFEGSLFETKALEETGHYERMSSSYRESSQTVLAMLGRMARKVKDSREGKVQEDEDDDPEIDAIMQWMAGILLNDEEEKGSAAGPSYVQEEEEYDDDETPPTPPTDSDPGNDHDPNPSCLPILSCSILKRLFCF